MTQDSQLTPAFEIDWDAVKEAAEADLYQSLQNSTEFLSATSLRAQIVIAYQILHNEHIPAVPLTMVARMFQMSRQAAKEHLKNYERYGEATGRWGRPSILSEEQHEALIQYALERSAARLPCTMGQLRAWIGENFEIAVQADTIWHWLKRDPRIKSCRAVPMEDKRLEVTAEQISAYFAHLFKWVMGVPAAFVFNMDEMGHQEWADRETKLCYVSSDIREDHVYVPVSRAGKRITLLACISADGSYLKPLVIIPRKTVDVDLFLHGWTDDKIMIRHQPKGFINTELFLLWFHEIFVPEVARRREQYDYRGRVILLLDNCTAHGGDDFKATCKALGIKCIFLPPHSSNQVQPLDLSLFGITKGALSRINRMESVNIQTDHILKLMNGFMAAANPTNIVQTFANAGICLLDDTLESGQRLLRCHIRPEKARCLNFTIEELLPREIPEGDADDDDIAEQLYIEVCATLFYPAQALEEE